MSPGGAEVGQVIFMACRPSPLQPFRAWPAPLGPQGKLGKRDV